MSSARERALGASRAFFRAAREPEAAVPLRAQRAVRVLSLASAALFFALSWLRYASFHDTTFDLAIYARMCWGELHGSAWEPIVNASVYGLHLVWIFEPLALVAALLGAVPTLLATQSLAVALAAVPLARIGARRFGEAGALVAALAFLLHPNVAAVACDEFHPGTVAVLPLAWAADALDRRNAHAMLLAALGIAACREDLALVGCFAASALAIVLHRRGEHGARNLALATAGLSLAYLLVFVLVLHPAFAPPAGSLSLHFGRHGSSVPAVLVDFATHPAELVQHLSENGRWAYVFVVAAPLALLPLLAPEGLVVVAPVLGVALLSEFPTTTCLDSHYLTPALPFLVRAAVVGAERARRLIPTWTLAPLLAATLAAHLVGGATPLSIRFDAAAFRDDARSTAMRAITNEIAPLASVQAPDAMLAHLAERRTLHRAPPPETNSDVVVLDLAHRRRFLHDEDLVRTDEEPIVRAWLARGDHAIVAAAGDFVLLERGLDPREGIDVERYVVGHDDRPEASETLTACLGLTSAHVDDDGVLELELVARGACPDDLALRVGTGRRPRRVDLIADGLFSPAHFLRGDRIRSRHALSTIEREAIARDGLHLGAIRASGARPEHEDPLSIEVALTGR
ncbi:MAG: DUF2079 domain-containing protein [Sandaracinus sp.]